ncbi:integrase, catalytic region, zinc finger, CCHC-type containing protein [Tanacetum coccineum]|uniref:Integrase, catalytic region, zinc finger, CCHC-type containing protein n=1 Tax=Tanacetum coccineum TaxID=301880 RepID=A0ABQ5BQ67_9ASTR
MIAPGSSRYSSNDMVHNHYLEEAKKKTQESSRNSEPSVMPSARSQSTANGSKPKPRINNQKSRNWPVSKSSCVTTKTVPIAEHSRNSRSFSDYKHFVCSTCQKCVFNANHDSCVTKFLNEVNSRAKVPSNKTTNRNKPVEQISFAKKPERQIPKRHMSSIKKTSVVHEKTMTPRSCLRWKPTGKIFKTVGLRWVPTGKIFTSSTTKVDSEPQNGSNADITNQYESAQTLDVSAGLNHNLFSVGQFCDADLEVAFRKSTCYIRDLKGNDLLKGSRGTDLYSITLQDSTTPNPICLMAKATSSQAWLWHRRLSHLNFDTINLLSKNNIVNGLPKLKFVKDHLCSSCELGKAKRKKINGKKYVLVIVDDYSRYTWTHFLRSKDETPGVLIDFLTLVQNLDYQSLVVSLPKPAKYSQVILKRLYDSCDSIDSDHAGCLDSRKSTSGGIQFLGGDKLVSWSSKKLDYTSISLAEAEYVSLSACCVQVLWLRTQLTYYGFHFDKIPMYCDSKAAIAISCNPVQHSRTKYIDVRYHFIKEQVEKSIVELFFVRTEYQLADLFTKALSQDRFKYLVRRLSMRCLTLDKLEVLAIESA